MTTVLEFVGEAFDPLAWTTPALPPLPATEGEPGDNSLPARRDRGAGVPQDSALPTVQAAPSRRIAQPPRVPPSEALRELRAALANAHASALRAQESLQRLQLARITTPNAPQPWQPADEAAFKPLARTMVNALTATDLAKLASGDIATVFGPRYDQQGANPDVRLATGPLAEVHAIELRGGSAGRGRVRASVNVHDPVAATVQAAQVFALYAGLHLCLADATFVLLDEPRVTASDGTQELDLEVEMIDLVPRPWLRVHASVGGSRVDNVVVALHVKPGVPVGPDTGGFPTCWLGRVSSRGERALLSEFHMAHLAYGDQGVALGPEFAHYTGRKATRIPRGGLLLVDRVIAIQGQRGKLDGATYQTEYDSPADSWYYADTANASMPNCIYMETSLQSALLIGYHLGATLPTPDATVSLRNLGGTATVLREVDLRDKTLRQDSELLSTTIMPGSTLQSFSYTLSVDGEPYYQGETLFGYFSDEALANQTGLDAGRPVPTWLAQQSHVDTRVLDVATRRADPAAQLAARGKLALLDTVTVVDGGGRYGKGYLHAERAIDPGDWFFDRHFHLDPVIPGSLGVESVIQAMQEWLLDAGYADGLHDPGFILPVGSPFTWKYRGQFAPSDGSCTFEVHIKDVQRRPGRVRVIGEASMWKPGLRIYELTDIAVELREEGAQPW